MNDELIRILSMILIPFLLVVCIMPYIKKLAFKIGAVDVPRTNHIHTKTIAKLGGLGIYSGFLLGYILFGTYSTPMMSVLIGSFIIILFGIIDDITELPPSTKLIGQIIAASVVAFYGNILLKEISAFGIYMNFGFLAYPLTIFFIVACINCINLIDGLDGLSGGISSIYFLTIGIIAVMKNKFGMDFVLTFIMFGSTLGFLVYNFPPAKIFAGDSGSMFLGFIISVIALLGFKNVTLTSLIVPLLILAIPILDTLFAILRRTLKGEKIVERDEFHIHHQLLKKNISIKNAVLIIYLVDILFAIASIIYVIKDRYLGYIVYGILFTIVTVFVINTTVVFDKKNGKKNKTKKTEKKID